MPSNKSARAKPVGSCTPFSFEQASHKFTFCILPSRICVRKTVASLHLQTSHNISVQLNLKTEHKFKRQPPAGGPCPPVGLLSSWINRGSGFARHLVEPRHRPGGDRSRFAFSNSPPIDLDHLNHLGRPAR